MTSFMMEGIHESGFKGMIVRYGIENPAEISASEIRLHEKGSSFILHTPGETRGGQSKDIRDV